MRSITPILLASLAYSLATVLSAAYLLVVGLQVGFPSGLQLLWLMGSLLAGLLSGVATALPALAMRLHPAPPVQIHERHNTFALRSLLTCGALLGCAALSALNNLVFFSSPLVAVPTSLFAILAGPWWAWSIVRGLALVPEAGTELPQDESLAAADQRLSEPLSGPRDDAAKVGPPRDEALLGLGNWDILQLNGLLQSAQYRTAALRMVTLDGRRSGGTGFLVASDVLITSWHVVKPVLDDELDPDQVHISFAGGPDGSGAAATHLADDWLLYRPASDDGPDVALVRIARPVGDLELPTPGAVTTRGWFQLRRPPRVDQDTPLVIVQFPEQRVQVAFGSVVERDDPFVIYRVDTEPGSSGSPCFAMYRLVAVHKGSFPAREANRGVLLDELIDTLKAASGG